MASYHFEIKSGRNAVDHADYIARQGFHGKHGDIVMSEHGNLPTWTGGEPKVLWNAGEKGERKNGAVYREAIIALPGELSTEQNKALVSDLVSKLCMGKPFQVAIHAPKSSIEGEWNPHAHLMVSDRVSDGIERPPERFFSRYNPKQPEKGGCKKASGGRDRVQLREDLLATRKLVADTINHHLAINGHEARVDHRTLKEQGVRRKPERHLGPARVRGMSVEEKAEYVAVRGGSRADEP